MELSLQDLLPGIWGADQPSRLIDLLNADYEDLDKTSKSLRALLVECLHGFERTPVLTALVCRDLLEKHHLPKVPGRWCAVSLNKNKEKVYDRVKGGSLRLSSLVRENVPSVEACNKLTIDKAGSLLLIYSGSVAVLNDDECFQRFASLATSFKVSDVVIWEEREKSVYFWSVAAGSGSVGNSEVELPDDISYERWAKLL